MRDNESALKGYEIVLDVDAPRGVSPLFPPVGELLRSELSLEDLPGKTNGGLRMVGGMIPGMRIYFSRKSMHCKIIDRMSLKENEDLAERIRQLSTTDEFRSLSFGRFVRDIDNSISKKDLPRWLFWIRRLIDHKRLRVVKGENEIPATYEEIIEMNGGPIQISEDNGLKPLNKDVMPFNVISMEDFPERELEKAGK